MRTGQEWDDTDEKSDEMEINAAGASADGHSKTLLTHTQMYRCMFALLFHAVTGCTYWETSGMSMSVMFVLLAHINY